MEEKKNNQVQAMDDDALENIAGGRIVNGLMDYSKQEYVYPWIVWTVEEWVKIIGILL